MLFDDIIQNDYKLEILAKNMCKNLYCVQIFVYICTIKMKQLTIKI